MAELMKLKLVICLLGLLKNSSSLRKASDSLVKSVSSSSFEQNVPLEKFAMILFFAPWQDSCDYTHDVFEKIARYYADNSDVIIARGNIYNDGKLASRFDVDDYCTIKYFVKGSRVAET